MMRTIQIDLELTPQIQEALITSKELYNSLNFYLRQRYFELCGQDIYKHNAFTQEELELMKSIVFNVNYPLKTEYINWVKRKNDLTLHAKVTQSLVNQLAKNWKSYFALRKQGDKTVNIPRYKKTYHQLTFNKQTFSRPALKNGRLKTWLFDVGLPKFALDVQSAILSMTKAGYPTLYVIYNERVNLVDIKDHYVIAGVDLGVRNLATVAFDEKYKPLTYKVSCLMNKLNHLNYQSDQLQSSKSPRYLKKIDYKNKLLKHTLHIVSNRMVQDLLSRNVKTVVIGKNLGWKDGVNIGRKNNRKFYQIPHAKFINILRYKLEAVGIDLIEQEESYTSKASFIDGDIIPNYEGNYVKPKFSGQRINRSNYITQDGILIHADVNAAYNIITKYNQSGNERLETIRNWLAKGCRVVQPLGVSINFNG